MTNIITEKTILKLYLEGLTIDMLVRHVSIVEHITKYKARVFVEYAVYNYLMQNKSK